MAAWSGAGSDYGPGTVGTVGTKFLVLPTRKIHSPSCLESGPNLPTVPRLPLLRGDGCDWCGGMGRIVDDEPEESRS